MNLLFVLKFQIPLKEQKLGKTFLGCSHCATVKWVQLVSMKMHVPSLALLPGLRIWHCCELWCRLKMWFGSWVAVAMEGAGGYSSDSTLRVGLCICHELNPEKQKKKKREREKKKKKKTFLCQKYKWNNLNVMYTTALDSLLIRNHLDSLKINWKIGINGFWINISAQSKITTSEGQYCYYCK